MAANTTTFNGHFIHILFGSDGASADWDLLADLIPLRPECKMGVRVKSMSARAAASDDVLTVRDALDAGTTGPIMWINKFTAIYDTRDKDYGNGVLCFPSVDSTEVAAGVKLTIEIAG